MKSTRQSPLPTYQSSRHTSSQQEQPIPWRFRFFMVVYSGLWHLLLPILRRHRRLKHGFSQRLVPKDWIPTFSQNTTKTLWIQAASGGEALIAESILSALEQHIASSMATGDIASSMATGDIASSMATGEKKLPSLTLVCSTCTLQGLEVLQRVASQNTFSHIQIYPTYFPLDIPKLMHKAMEKIRPDAIVLLETELWPGLLFEAKKKNIPLLVANGRMTEKSASSYRFLRGFLSRFSPQYIMATTKEDAQRFKHVFPNAEVEKSSNCKFDIAKHLLEKKNTAEIPSPHQLLKKSIHTPTVLLASVREEEEEILLQTVVSLVKNHGNTANAIDCDGTTNFTHHDSRRIFNTHDNTAIPTSHDNTASPSAHDNTASPTSHDNTAIPTSHDNTASPSAHDNTAIPTSHDNTASPTSHDNTASPTSHDNTAIPIVIIAPRHLHRARAWVEHLTQQNMPVILRSEGISQKDTSCATTQKDRSCVIVWDTFGELSSLYAYCDAIFVGGSFAPLGGQNFLEPLAFGKAPFVGRYLDNFLWVGRSIMEEGLVTQLDMPQDLAPALLQSMKKNSPSEREAIQQRFSSWIVPRTGGSKAIAKKIIEIISKSTSIL